jgi:hypothetical protein
MASVGDNNSALPPSSPLAARFTAWLCGVAGYIVLAVSIIAAASLVTWNVADPSLTHATSGPTRNMLGPVGAIFSDLVMQLLGLAGVFVILPPVFWGLEMIGNRRLQGARAKLAYAPAAVALLACAASALPKIGGWPLPYGLGGALGDFALGCVTRVLAMIRPERASAAAGLFCFAGGIVLFIASLGLTQRDLKLIFRAPRIGMSGFARRAWRRLGEMSEPTAGSVRREPKLDGPMPPHFSMPAYRAAPAGGFGTGPGTFGRPDRHQPACEPGFGAIEADDVDPDLERIVGICAPKSAARPVREDEDRVAPRAQLRRPALFPDPITDARRVMAAEDTPMGQAPPAPPRHHEFPQHGRQAGYGVDPHGHTPAIAPAQAEDWHQRSMPGGDPLYGRAVAIVLTDRKASTGYLERLLQIGYMRAADLIDQMERDGIVGAPVYNGIRPILLEGPPSEEI